MFSSARLARSLVSRLAFSSFLQGKLDAWYLKRKKKFITQFVVQARLTLAYPHILLSGWVSQSTPFPPTVVETQSPETRSERRTLSIASKMWSSTDRELKYFLRTEALKRKACTILRFHHLQPQIPLSICCGIDEEHR